MLHRESQRDRFDEDARDVARNADGVTVVTPGEITSWARKTLMTAPFGDVFLLVYDRTWLPDQRSTITSF
jgi:hypothetical protein